MKDQVNFWKLSYKVKSNHHYYYLERASLTSQVLSLWLYEEQIIT